MKGPRGGVKALVRMGDVVRTVSIEHAGDTLLARVDDREYRLNAHEAQPGVWSFVHVASGEAGGRSIEALVAAAPAGSGLMRVRVRDRVFEGQIERPGAPRAGERTAEGRWELKALMPGKVVKLLVKNGESVRKGQGIAVVEAMKMQNEIDSPKDGVVRALPAAPGSSVEAGAVLAVIE